MLTTQCIYFLYMVNYGKDTVSACIRRVDFMIKSHLVSVIYSNIKFIMEKLCSSCYSISDL